MERSRPQRAALALIALGACSSPQPAVDEERIARRVVDLLRREGLALARDGGAPEDDPDEADEAAEDEAPQGEPAAPAPAPQRAPARASRAAGTHGRGVARPRPAVSDATFTPAVTTGEGNAARVWISLQGAATLGPADALVTAVAFVDAECPFCARLYGALRALQRAHATELRVVVRHRPLTIHAAAWGGDVFAEFARARGGDAAYFTAFDRLFENARALDRGSLEAHATAMGLDPMHLVDALSAPEVTPFDRAVAADDALGESAGVQGTPTTFFNGRRVTGAVPQDALEAVFDEERTRANAALARGIRRAALYDHLCRTPASDAPVTPRRSPARAR